MQGDCVQRSLQRACKLSHVNAHEMIGAYSSIVFRTLPKQQLYFIIRASTLVFSACRIIDKLSLQLRKKNFEVEKVFASNFFLTFCIHTYCFAPKVGSILSTVDGVN